MDETIIRPEGNNSYDNTLDNTLNTTLDTTLRVESTMSLAKNGNDNLDVTGRMDIDAKTIRGMADNMSDSNTPADTDVFEINGKFYKKLKCLSDNSGEAQVFLVENDGNKLVLKIYYPNFSVKKKLLRIIAGIQFEMIVNVFDFGKMYVDGVNRDYEIMEYLKGGTLNEYKLNNDFDQFRRIALQAAAALEYCHNNNIIHKDIKPGNFFFRDENHTQIVLGDFGISSVISDKKELHRTTQARTPIYASPEMYNDVIDGIVELTPASDFYSLGVTLLTLWRGASPFNVGERTIMKRKNEGRLPGVDTLPERVKMIVKGLTAVNIQKRWTYNEVERWFLGESPEVDITSPFLRYKTFVVDPERNLVAENVRELIPMLLANERIAKGYLYGGRLANWFDSCGNTKTAMVLKDIVTNKYPIDQHAGLMAAVYAMDPSWPYTDITGQECNDMHSVAISLVINSANYQVLLRNPNDDLWVYLESHTDCDVNRMRGYFTGKQNDNPKISLMRTVYEMDKDMPFFANYKSRSIRDIIRCFGYEDMNEDNWRSITDGRLLAWMYSHEDKMACEAMRIMTEGQAYSKTLAYKVLYNIDRTAAFDLKEANTPEKVGTAFAQKLKQWQALEEKEFQKKLEELCGKDGRFLFYAQLHGWTKQIHDFNRCFDMQSDENKERLGDYNLRTAAYRFCRLLGCKPTYLLPSGKELDNGTNIDTQDIAEMKNEMRNACLSQWMSVYYHENPHEDFSQEYSYEQSLEKWLMAIGTIDPQQNYYRRFIKAKQETARKYEEVRNEYVSACRQTKLLKILFYTLSAILAVTLIVAQIKGTKDILANGSVKLLITIGIPTALIVGVKSFFKGYGALFAFFLAVIGFFSAVLPLFAMRFVNASIPSYFIPVVLLIEGIYVAIAHFTDTSKESKEDKQLITEVMDDDMKSSLLEPLYYTFKTKSIRFRGSKFNVLDDVKNQFKSVSSDSVIHYALWSIFALVVLVGLFLNNIL